MAEPVQRKGSPAYKKGLPTVMSRREWQNPATFVESPQAWD